METLDCREGWILRLGRPSFEFWLPCLLAVFPVDLGDWLDPSVRDASCLSPPSLAHLPKTVVLRI